MILHYQRRQSSLTGGGIGEKLCAKEVRGIGNQGVAKQATVSARVEGCRAEGCKDITRQTGTVSQTGTGWAPFC